MYFVWATLIIYLVATASHKHKGCSPLFVLGQPASATCDSLHPAIVARIDKELGPWKVHGLSDALMRNASRYCKVVNRPDCQAKYIRVLIENGTMYLNSLFSRKPGWEGYGREAAGEWHKAELDVPSHMMSTPQQISSM